MKFLVLALFLSSCTTTEQQKSKLTYDLTNAIDVRTRTVELVKVDKDGLSEEIKKDCDGILWQGQWCSATGCDLVGYEDTRKNGRFYRRPQPRCWERIKSEQGLRQGSASTWSRDMFVCGLGVYTLYQQKLDILERHIDYGFKNNFAMGRPYLAKGNDPRVFYTPNVQAYLFRSFASLGGKKHLGYYWPTTYGAGLSDYHAHLQLCSIWARGVSSGEINKQMLARVKEHYLRDDKDLWAAYLWGRYTGDYGRIYNQCSNHDIIVPKYVRCGKGRKDCKAIHKAFICTLMIDDLRGTSHEG